MSVSDRSGPGLLPRALAGLAAAALVLSGCAVLDGGGDREALSATGLTGIELGQHYNDIIAVHADFPGQDSGRDEGDQVVIDWEGSGWVFSAEGVLEEIRPDDGETVDGIGVGDELDEATSLYGTPHLVEEGPGSAGEWLYPASTDDGTAWRIRSEEGGEITQVALCQCLPAEMVIEAQGVHVTLSPYRQGGGLRPEFEDLVVPERDPGNHRWACSASQEEPSLYSCGWAQTDYRGPSDCTVDEGEMRAWCPGIDRDGGVFFEELPLSMVGDYGYDPRPQDGLRPASLLLEDRGVCIPGSPLGPSRQGEGEVSYRCEGQRFLYGPITGSDSDGYTARVGPDDPRVALRDEPIERMLTIKP